MRQETGEELRGTFSSRYPLERHLAGLAEAITSLERPAAFLGRATAAPAS